MGVDVFRPMVNNTNKYHWVALGNGPRMFAQTGQHPGSLLADTYECIDGLRIDESPLYDPKAPNKNRDPRFGATLKCMAIRSTIIRLRARINL